MREQRAKSTALRGRKQLLLEEVRRTSSCVSEFSLLAGGAEAGHAVWWRGWAVRPVRSADGTGAGGLAIAVRALLVAGDGGIVVAVPVWAVAGDGLPGTCWARAGWWWGR